VAIRTHGYKGSYQYRDGYEERDGGESIRINDLQLELVFSQDNGAVTDEML